MNFAILTRIGVDRHGRRRLHGRRMSTVEKESTARAVNGISQPDLSPELVLVSPETAKRVRATLPDRPWEAFLPPPPLPAAVPSASCGRRGRRVARGALPYASIAAFVAVLIAGSVFPVRDGPTLARPSTAPSQQPPARNLAAPRKRMAPVPRAAASRSTRTTLEPAGAAPVGAAAPFAGQESFRFVVDPRRHVIARFEGTFRCAGRLTLENIGIRPDRTFTVTHRFGGRDRVTIWLAGSVDLVTVRGTFRAAHGACDTGPVAFRAPAAGA